MPKRMAIPHAQSMWNVVWLKPQSIGNLQDFQTTPTLQQMGKNLHSL